ncbi:hypothetical protein HPB52_018938 [Rhipicephalus sanguineus]|uniref:GH18 domain-containing protein n=1 Tax=Rhipicephalus sanguineus TaxID=34632 RepID=A0A9D4PYD8_RHISA|nr:hypothetical protein HPB52_018938 [Rhipicephalus sanguineus]
MCPNVVYWSWSLPRGVLTSRAHKFDETYGLGAIGDAARQQNADVQVFLVLGGFREDSVDFHKVSRDPIIRQRLVQDLFNAFTVYNLSGIALHWVPHSRVCEDFYGSGVPQLADFVSSVTRLVALNRPDVAFKVAALVDPQHSTEMEFLRSIRIYLNLTFFKTHHILPSEGFANYCANSVPVFQSQLALLKALFEKPVKTGSPTSNLQEGLCMSFSLSLHARQGANIERPAAVLPVSATPGYMALFEVCDSQVKFNGRVPVVSGCLIKRSSAPSLDVIIAYD